MTPSPNEQNEGFYFKTKRSSFPKKGSRLTSAAVFQGVKTEKPLSKDRRIKDGDEFLIPFHKQ
jgi:hypothetical protein